MHYKNASKKRKVNVAAIATRESSRLLQFLEECGEWRTYGSIELNKL
jgi:hypothetical protein